MEARSFYPGGQEEVCTGPCRACVPTCDNLIVSHSCILIAVEGPCSAFAQAAHVGAPAASGQAQAAADMQSSTQLHNSCARISI